MKFFKPFLIVIVSLLISNKVFSATGCSTYQGLYPNSLNTTHVTTGNVYYDNTGYIEFRTWDDDPRCGIRDNKVISLGQACDVNGVRDWGVLVSYDPADNNCQVNLPLDDYIWVLGVILGGLAYLKLVNAKKPEWT